MKKIQEKSILVRVGKGASYRESTVRRFLRGALGSIKKPKNRFKNYPEPINSDRFQ